MNIPFSVISLKDFTKDPNKFSKQLGENFRRSGFCGINDHEIDTDLVKEVQDVYRLQGVSINDKHIEVILRQMLRKVEITSAGDTTLMPGEQMEKTQLLEMMDNLKSKNPDVLLPTFKPMLLGITKASLVTCLLYTSPSPRDNLPSRMPSSA